MAPKKDSRAKKTSTPIPPAGSTSVDATDSVKTAIIANLATKAEPEPAFVDEAFGYDIDSYKVHSKDDKNYSVYLNCADIKNNSNKYYIC